MTTGAKYSPASLLARPFHAFVSAKRKYGAEWWILIAGAVIVLFIIYMALFPATLAPYDPLDQEAGPQMAAPSPEASYTISCSKRGCA